MIVACLTRLLWLYGKLEMMVGFSVNFWSIHKGPGCFQAATVYVCSVQMGGFLFKAGGNFEDFACLTRMAWSYGKLELIDDFSWYFWSICQGQGF
jgi:hypothetical protein